MAILRVCGRLNEDAGASRLFPLAAGPTRLADQKLRRPPLVRTFAGNMPPGSGAALARRPKQAMHAQVATPQEAWCHDLRDLPLATVAMIVQTVLAPFVLGRRQAECRAAP
jgi:hypothetical protein